MLICITIPQIPKIQHLSHLHTSCIYDLIIYSYTTVNNAPTVLFLMLVVEINRKINIHKKNVGKHVV